MNYKDIQKEVIERYRVKIDTNSSCWGRMHAHVKERRICKWKAKNSIQATFDLFHEIGHIETTTSKMRRMESELYATLWAFDRCREYGLKIPAKTFELYRDYIWRELERGKRRGGTGYPEIDLPIDVVEDLGYETRYFLLNGNGELIFEGGTDRAEVERYMRCTYSGNDIRSLGLNVVGLEVCN